MQNKSATAATGVNEGIVFRDHAAIGKAEDIPVSASPTPVLSVSPVVLSAPGRGGDVQIDLHIRVSAPTTGRNLPILLLSHGQGGSNNLSSLNGYGPLVNFWAAHGFVVIQPTHLSSKTSKPRPKDLRGAIFLAIPRRRYDPHPRPSRRYRGFRS